MVLSGCLGWVPREPLRRRRGGTSNGWIAGEWLSSGLKRFITAKSERYSKDGWKV